MSAAEAFGLGAAALALVVLAGPIVFLGVAVLRMARIVGRLERTPPVKQRKEIRGFAAHRDGPR